MTLREARLFGSTAIRVEFHVFAISPTRRSSGSSNGGAVVVLDQYRWRHLSAA